MLNWANKLKEVQQYDKRVETAMVAANNHYAGFGQATSKIFREMIGLEPVQWAIDKDLPTKVEFEEVRNRR